MTVRRSIGSLLVGVTLLAAGLAPAAPGQEAPCTYDRCALRLQHRFLRSTRIVRGSDDTVVARVGLFAPRVEPLATARGTPSAGITSSSDGSTTRVS